MMVRLETILSCAPIVNIPLLGRTQLLLPSFYAFTTPRSWEISEPMLTQDGDPDWVYRENQGSLYPEMAAISCDTQTGYAEAVFGQLIDANTRLTHIIYPNPELDDSFFFSKVKVRKIDDRGPNDGKFWIEEADLIVHQMSVFNRWVRPDSTRTPGNSSTTWYAENEARGCCSESGAADMHDWWEAQKAHEAYGNHSTPDFLGASGHFGRIVRMLSVPPNDPRKLIENITGSTENVVREAAISRVMEVEKYLREAADAEHRYVNLNWAYVNNDDDVLDDDDAFFYYAGWHNATSLRGDDMDDVEADGKWAWELPLLDDCDCQRYRFP